jgi:hypothetical protein
LLQRGYPLIAVDNQIVLGLLGCYHDDRRLLTAGRQRRQQATMPLRTMHPKVLQTPLKLVEFQLHPCRPRIRYYPNMSQAGSGIARPELVVAPDHSWNQYDRKLSGIASSAAVVRP